MKLLKFELKELKKKFPKTIMLFETFLYNSYGEIVEWSNMSLMSQIGPLISFTNEIGYYVSVDKLINDEKELRYTSYLTCYFIVDNEKILDPVAVESCDTLESGFYSGIMKAFKVHEIKSVKNHLETLKAL